MHVSQRSLQVRTPPESLRSSGIDPFRTFALPSDVEHLSLTSLREKLVKIGAKVVAHGRDVTFQMAEVAVPRTYSGKSCCGSMIYGQDPLRLDCRIGRRETRGELCPENRRNWDEEIYADRQT